MKTNKNKKELIRLIILCLFILMTEFYMVAGFSELIQNASVGVITFYAVATIFFTIKLGNLLVEPLTYIFSKNNNKGGKKKWDGLDG